MSALTSVIAEQDGAVILGGNEASTWASRWSLWGIRPYEVFECNSKERNPLVKLQQYINRYRLQQVETMDSPCPFVGGWIGFFSYDLGRFIETIVSVAIDDLRTPLIRLVLYDRLIAYDHGNKTFWLIVLDIPGDPVSVKEKFDILSTLVKHAEKTVIPSFPEHELQLDSMEGFHSNMTPSDYFRSIDRIQRHIYDGNVYQINFSQRFSCPCSISPIHLFQWQNRYNPSPFSAFLQSDNLALVSTSPELFLSVRNGKIITRPIKGTRRRYSTGPKAKKSNRVNFRDLVESEKEQAELNMIVDLERNDLARICTPGTRRVIQPRTIEEYPTVYHAVATIEGDLACFSSNTWLYDILKATFPGGSITGAPKIRAMELIETLEPSRRGVYTGCIGWIGLDRMVCLNIAIRTILIQNQTAYIQTGGGIVADSNPTAEYEETIIKAYALLAGIKAVEKTVSIGSKQKRKISTVDPLLPGSKKNENLRK